MSQWFGRVVLGAARRHHRCAMVVAIGLLLAACGGSERSGIRAFVGARVIDGTGAAPLENATMVVRDGRVAAVGPRDAVTVPRGAEAIDLAGRTVIPGLINAHGHVGDTRGLETGQYSVENVEDHVRRYARYGVTTIQALGGDQEAALPIRARRDSATLDHARLYIAGTVVAAQTADEARAMIDRNATLNPDVVKIRVDDNLGTAQKMPADVFRAAIEYAHQKGLRVASHLYYLDDAKALVRAGVEFIAHSVRDREVDDELIGLLKERGVCYCPTLMREVSTYVYERTPPFFDDPFFLAEADSAVLAQLRDPARQRRIGSDRAAQTYKRGLPLAKRNLKKLADAGVKIAMGTDTGPPARFQGYFEHLELEQMVDAGLTPMQALVAATGAAASCLRLADIGTLQAGMRADFVVLRANPLEDITNTRTVESVWVAGNRVPALGASQVASTR